MDRCMGGWMVSVREDGWVGGWVNGWVVEHTGGWESE